MKPNIASYQLIPEGNASDDPFPALTAIFLQMVAPDGKQLELQLTRKLDLPVTLVLKGEGKVVTDLKNIVCIESPTDPSHQKTNNKIVYFTNRKPGVLVDFTASKDIQEKLHLSSNEMIEIYRGIYVNKLYINNFDGKYLFVKTFDETKPHKIPVSRSHRNEIKELTQNTH